MRCTKMKLLSKQCRRRRHDGYHITYVKFGSAILWGVFFYKKNQNIEYQPFLYHIFHQLNLVSHQSILLISRRSWSACDHFIGLYSIANISNISGIIVSPLFNSHTFSSEVNIRWVRGYHTFYSWNSTP